MRLPLAFGLEFILSIGLTFGQNVGGSLKFEAASVKLSPQSAGIYANLKGGPGTSDPGLITYKNVTIRRILEKALGAGPYQLIGPGWIDSQRLDLVVSIPLNTSTEEFRTMLQNLLIDRLGLRMHTEPKEMKVYALVLKSRALKLAEHDNAGDVHWHSGGRHISVRSINNEVLMESRGGSMAEFADALSTQLDRPVIDRTALHAIYDFSCNFSLDSALGDRFTARQRMSNHRQCSAHLRSSWG